MRDDLKRLNLQFETLSFENEFQSENLFLLVNKNKLSYLIPFLVKVQNELLNQFLLKNSFLNHNKSRWMTMMIILKFQIELVLYDNDWMITKDFVETQLKGKLLRWWRILKIFLSLKSLRREVSKLIQTEKE